MWVDEKPCVPIFARLYSHNRRRHFFAFGVFDLKKIQYDVFIVVTIKFRIRQCAIVMGRFDAHSRRSDKWNFHSTRGPARLAFSLDEDPRLARIRHNAS